MNNLVVLLIAVVFLSGCIVIEGLDVDNSTNDTSDDISDVDFGLDKEIEKAKAQDELADDSPIRADLEVTEAYWSTLFPDTGENDDFNFRVLNKGNSSVSGFNYQIKVFNDDGVIKEQNYEYAETLEPEGKIKISQPFTFDSEGKFKAEVNIDWDNSIREWDEMNNYKQTPSVTVADPEVSTDDSSSDSDSESDDTNTTTTTATKKCQDTDDGLNYYTKGRCIDDGPFILGMDDYCKSNEELVELYCSESSNRCRFADPYECYCKNGACVFE